MIKSDSNTNQAQTASTEPSAPRSQDADKAVDELGSTLENINLQGGVSRVAENAKSSVLQLAEELENAEKDAKIWKDQANNLKKELADSEKETNELKVRVKQLEKELDIARQ
ncbi:hypothetical protein HK100_008055, partial [Physocladia obscura]